MFIMLLTQNVHTVYVPLTFTTVFYFQFIKIRLVPFIIVTTDYNEINCKLYGLIVT